MAAKLQAELKGETIARLGKFKVMAEQQTGDTSSSTSASVSIDGNAKALTVLYGSETGNSEGLALRLVEEAKKRSVPSTLSAMNDYDVENWLRLRAVWHSSSARAVKEDSPRMPRPSTRIWLHRRA